MPRPGARNDQVIANECLTMLNRAESHIISTLRRYYPHETPQIYNDLVKTLESLHSTRKNILTLKKKMGKRDKTIRKYKKIIKAFNKENAIEVPIPPKFFDIETIPNKNVPEGKAFLVDLDDDEVIQVLK